MAGEFALIEQLLRQTRVTTSPTCHTPLLGPGDDCALINHSQPGLAWAVTTDMLVSGIHFLDSDAPYDLGWKTLAVNLSDLAAMGATPRFVTLAAAIRAEDAQETTWIESFFSGFVACAQTYDVVLIGGDTTRGERTFSVTAMGEVVTEHALKRSGAKANDDIWVSGTPGYAALGLQNKLHGVTLPPAIVNAAANALHHPQPRVALGMGLRDIAHAAIDISDGLLQDLGHITQASGLGATLNAATLPACPPEVDPLLWQRCLLGGGDDYELLFTAPASARDQIAALAKTLALPLTRIGQMHTLAADNDTPPIQILDAAQCPLDLSKIRLGFDHFTT